MQFADSTQSEGVVSTSQSREVTVTEPQATVGRKCQCEFQFRKMQIKNTSGDRIPHVAGCSVGGRNLRNMNKREVWVTDTPVLQQYQRTTQAQSSCPQSKICEEVHLGAQKW